MLEDLHMAKKVIGVKQVCKALHSGLCREVYIALDADPLLTRSVRELCDKNGVLLTEVPSMTELGRLCGIAVGASAAGRL